MVAQELINKNINIKNNMTEGFIELIYEGGGKCLGIDHYIKKIICRKMEENKCNYHQLVPFKYGTLSIFPLLLLYILAFSYFICFFNNNNCIGYQYRQV